MPKSKEREAVQKYNRIYYEKNKDKIAARKKQRYKTNKGYRNSIRQRTKEQHEQEKRRKMASGYDRRIITDGRAKFISIGKLGEIINRSAHTIRAYHKQGVLPDTGYCDTRGWRLYSTAQALVLKKIFARFDRNEIPSLQLVGSEIENEWEKLNG